MRIYREDDWVAQVEVLKNESDENWYRFTLKVIKTINESHIYKPVPEGTVLKVDKMRGNHWPGLWDLQGEDEL